MFLVKNLVRLEIYFNLLDFGLLAFSYNFANLSV